MSAFTEFYLNTFSNIGKFECYEISHPNFSKEYYLVQNAINGLTVTHEDATVHTYQYYPLQSQFTGARDNLDSTIQIALGDLGEVFPLELDNVTTANGFGTPPTVIYRLYRSDMLNTPMDGPLYFQATSFSTNKDGVSFEIKAPELNLNLTGQYYTLDVFPMLQGFL